MPIVLLIRTADRPLVFVRRITAEILTSLAGPNAPSFPTVRAIRLVSITDAWILAPVFAGSNRSVASSTICPSAAAHKAIQASRTARAGPFQFSVS